MKIIYSPKVGCWRPPCVCNARSFGSTLFKKLSNMLVSIRRTSLARTVSSTRLKTSSSASSDNGSSSKSIELKSSTELTTDAIMQCKRLLSNYHVYILCHLYNSKLTIQSKHQTSQAIHKETYLKAFLIVTCSSHRAQLQFSIIAAALIQHMPITKIVTKPSLVYSLLVT